MMHHLVVWRVVNIILFVGAVLGLCHPTCAHLANILPPVVVIHGCCLTWADLQGYVDLSQTPVLPTQQKILHVETFPHLLVAADFQRLTGIYLTCNLHLQQAPLPPPAIEYAVKAQQPLLCVCLLGSWGDVRQKCLAQQNGRVGDCITVKNISTGVLLQVRITGRGEVQLQP